MTAAADWHRIATALERIARALESNTAIVPPMAVATPNAPTVRAGMDGECDGRLASTGERCGDTNWRTGQHGRYCGTCYADKKLLADDWRGDVPARLHTIDYNAAAKRHGLT